MTSMTGFGAFTFVETRLRSCAPDGVLTFALEQVRVRAFANVVAMVLVQDAVQHRQRSQMAEKKLFGCSYCRAERH